jgi:hypothetical protein
MGYELNSTSHSLGSRIINFLDAGFSSGESHNPNDYLHRMDTRARGRRNFILRQKKMKVLPGEEERVELRHRDYYGYDIVLHRPGQKEESLGQVGINNLKGWTVQESIASNPDYGEFKNLKSYEAADSLALKRANKLARKIARQRNLPLEHLVIEDDKEREGKRLANEIDSLRLRRVSSIILFFAGIFLSIHSLQLTGNASGNLTGTSQGLLGLIFFVVGLAGLVFSRR